MTDDKIILMIYAAALCLYFFYKKKHPKKKQLIYTAELDETLEKIQQLRTELNRLERLQTELDIADMDNCFSKTISINWGSHEDDNYILQIATGDTSDLKNLIKKERIRLTTSLTEELSKLPQTVKSKGNDKTEITAGEVILSIGLDTIKKIY